MAIANDDVVTHPPVAQGSKFPWVRDGVAVGRIEGAEAIGGVGEEDGGGIDGRAEDDVSCSVDDPLPLVVEAGTDVTVVAVKTTSVVQKGCG
jgi:hypothetical protein